MAHAQLHEQNFLDTKDFEDLSRQSIDLIGCPRFALLVIYFILLVTAIVWDVSEYFVALLSFIVLPLFRCHVWPLSTTNVQRVADLVDDEPDQFLDLPDLVDSDDDEVSDDGHAHMINDHMNRRPRQNSPWWSLRQERFRRNTSR